MASAIGSASDDRYAGQSLPRGAPHPRYHEESEDSEYYVRYNDEFIPPYRYYFKSLKDAKAFRAARVEKIEKVIAEYAQLIAKKLSTDPPKLYCPVCFADGRKLVRSDRCGRNADGEFVWLCDLHAGKSTEIEALDLQDEAKRLAHSEAVGDGYCAGYWERPKAVYKPKPEPPRTYPRERMSSLDWMLEEIMERDLLDDWDNDWDDDWDNGSDESDDVPELMDVSFVALLAGNPYAPLALLVDTVYP